MVHKIDISTDSKVPTRKHTDMLETACIAVIKVCVVMHRIMVHIEAVREEGFLSHLLDLVFYKEFLIVLTHTYASTTPHLCFERKYMHFCFLLTGACAAWASGCLQ